MSAPSLQPGEMRFHQWCEPPLTAGLYRLDAAQTSPELEAAFATALDFVVDAPRFAFLPTDVYSVYPPKGQAGEFGGTFPHIVLSRRTLPWERTLEPGSRRGSGDTTPWLALLTVSAADFGGAFPEPETRMVSALLDPGDKIAGPRGIKLLPHENPQHLCAMIDIPARLFSAIAPSRGDIALLTHVREVNTGAKETAAYLGDGWHSVVVGNRLPRAEPGNEVENRVYLVSLEGMAYALPPAANAFDGKASVRLAVLSSWSFRTRGGQGFKNAAAKMDSDALRLPWDDNAGGDREAKERVQRALRMGYTALTHTTRLGEKTVSWYRGPLIPIPPGEPLDAFCPTADAALGYVPEDGMFDVSHAAAFQLGRLLGLQSRHFAQSLQQFRRQMRSRINQVLERYRLKDTFSIRDALRVKDVDARDLLREVLVPGRAGGASNWKVAPARSIALKDGDTGLSLADDFDLEIPPAVSRWLARLVLLYRVPFVYLVPDQRMLEKGWIRFFYLDRNWIKHLLEGACSVGRSTSRDELADARLRRNFMKLALEKAMDVRRETRPGPAHSGEEKPKWPLTGFLMRSPIVEGWQGLEMRAWEGSGDNASNPLTPLRIDRIAPDIVLCIFNGRVGRIEIKQPPEGLHFGLAKLDGGFGKTHFRDAEGKLKENPIMATMRGDSAGVLDVASFAKKIGDALHPASPLGSSDFALHMIERPGRLIFDRTHPAVR